MTIYTYRCRNFVVHQQEVWQTAAEVAPECPYCGQTMKYLPSIIESARPIEVKDG
jgi:predicted nucleic acid-binding Zn ribbon protein